MTDFATLCIATHTALQVFRPKPSVLGPGGLYKFRHSLYTAFIVLPAFLASLAFARGRYAYQSQGPFCTLPVRPFWYRIATSWLPRYFVILFSVILYLAIYIHAEHEFSDSKLFRGKLGQAVRRLSDARRRGRMNTPDPEMSTVPRQSESFASRDREQLPQVALAVPTGSQHLSQNSLQIQSVDTTRHNSAATAGTGQQLLNRPSLALDHSGNHLTPHTRAPSQMLVATTSQAHVSGNTGSNATDSSLSVDEQAFELDEMRRKRNAIRRQLKLLFIYPIVHFVTYIGPFVLHITLYQTELAMHPIWKLGLWAYFSYGILGFLDALVFVVREKPWRHIPGSDASLLNAFMFWRQDFSERAREARRIAVNANNTSRRESTLEVSPTRRMSTDRRMSTASRRRQKSVSHKPDIVPELRTAPQEPSAGIRGMAAWDFGKSQTSEGAHSG